MTRTEARIISVAALVPMGKRGRVRMPAMFYGARPFAHRLFSASFRRGVRTGWRGWP